MTAAKTSTPSTSDWNAQKARLKAKFPRLTDADLNFEATRKQEMLTKLQVRVGRTARELQVIIETL